MRAHIRGMGDMGARRRLPLIALQARAAKRARLDRAPEADRAVGVEAALALSAGLEAQREARELLGQLGRMQEAGVPIDYPTACQVERTFWPQSRCPGATARRGRDQAPGRMGGGARDQSGGRGRGFRRQRGPVSTAAAVTATGGGGASTGRPAPSFSLAIGKREPRPGQRACHEQDCCGIDSIMKRPTLPLTALQRREICVVALVDDKTLKRALRGDPVRSLCMERIRRALKSRGWLSLLPAAPVAA
jgi:hypothetical protein